MKKLFRSKKALSPVVAVAAWMGALTFGFMGGSEQVKIVGVEFLTGTPRQIKVTVQNAGTSAVTITAGKVGDTVISLDSEQTIDAGGSAQITFDYDWVNGTSYNVGVVTKAGNVFTYYATAPS